MNKIFLQNILIFFVSLAICLTGLSYIVISHTITIDKINDRVQHAYIVIDQSQQLDRDIRAMLANQRGYLLTGDEKLLNEFAEKEALISQHLAMLSNLIADNPSQVTRLNELQHHYLKLADTLKEAIQTYEPQILGRRVEDLGIADNLNRQITDVNNTIREEEYNILNQRIKETEAQKTRYIITFVVSGAATALILLLMIWFLFRAQALKGIAEKNLQAAEERLRLALAGTNDGIYDWNIRTNEVIYSDQFWLMLGYRPDEFKNIYESFKDLVHPEDWPRVEEETESYLTGMLSEFSITFRMKHASGQWIWVNSRGKALYNDEGKPIRMVGAHTDINHIKAHEEKLKEAKEKAEAANEAKTEFLAHMSHEIRTPLTAIGGIAEILEKNMSSMNERQQKLVMTLGTSTASLKDLINDILDFSKIENGQVELKKETFPLPELFQQVISIIAVKANEKGLEFRFLFDDVEDIKFTGDKGRLRQIFINLIGNAVKFTEEGYVHVQAYQAEWKGVPALRVDIEDTGVGIAAENIEHIFERFQQGDRFISRKYGGTGLGLPISRNLVRLMNGEIMVESEEGKGSTFTLIIPLSQEKGVEVTEADIQDDYIHQKIGEAEERRVLLVEDYEGNVIMLSYILESLGFSFDVARTGVEAVEFYKSKAYDLILMDIQMPEMDGLTAADEIRSYERQRNLDHTPIIGMTAHATVGDKDKCLDAGMNSYLPKPIIEADLEKQIFSFIKTGNQNTRSSGHHS